MLICILRRGKYPAKRATESQVQAPVELRKAVSRRDGGRERVMIGVGPYRKVSLKLRRLTNNNKRGKPDKVVADISLEVWRYE